MSALDSIARLRQQTENLGHLFDQSIWVCAGGRNRDGSPNKAPKNYKAPWAYASSTNPSTWGTLDQVEAAARRYPQHIEHVGIVSGPWVKILDWDHKPHAEQPLIVETQAGLFSHCYQELSVSGRGLRCLFVADADKMDFKKTKFDLEPGVELEIFSSAQWAILTGNTTNAAPVSDASEEIASLLALLTPEPVARPVPAPVRPLSGSATPAGPGERGKFVINAFNAAYTVESLLVQYGYELVGGRYVSPTSRSGTAGVTILTGDDGQRRAYTHHRNDVLDDKHAHDAFDLYKLFEHGGDKYAAVKAAASLLGMSYARNTQTASGIDLDTVKANWTEAVTLMLEPGFNALDQIHMHHNARTPLRDVWCHLIVLASEGHISIVNGRPCIMAGGMAGLAATLSGRPADVSARLRFLATHGFLGGIQHVDPSDRHSALMIEIPASPSELPFLAMSSEYLRGLNVRVDTVDARRGNLRGPVGQKVTKVNPTSKRPASPTTGGVNPKKAGNELQDAMRVAFVLSRAPGLSRKELAKRCRIRAATLTKHLAVLTEAKLYANDRLLVSFQEFWRAARAAVADRTLARLRGYWEAAVTFAESSLRFARFGVSGEQATIPARQRLLDRARSRLLDSDTYLRSAA